MPTFIFHISQAFLKEFISALIFMNLHIDNEPQIPCNKVLIMHFTGLICKDVSWQ